MTEYYLECGLYWRPLGGNNIDQISGHCYQYTDVKKTGSTIKASTIIVDLGKFDNHQAFGIKNSAAAVPDIRELLQMPFLHPKAIFLTHSHPDHLNGIIHYIKAGIQLPELYGGRYTQLILNDLYKEYDIESSLQPKFNIINTGDIIKKGSLTLEVISSSHTCFDSFGFIISNHQNISVYHSGDMKTDDSICFRKPTDLKRIKQLAPKIKFCVIDFYGVADDGFATREIDTYKTIVKLINNTSKNNILIPVYPTHAEMYLLAFLAALKTKCNVVFYGNKDFYSYLNLIKQYGIDFEKIAKNRISIQNNINKKSKTAIIGTYNELANKFSLSEKNCFGIITSGTFFNPLRGQLNAHNISFTDVKKYPQLQGCGHAFWGDIERLASILLQTTFIPTHCPRYIIDECRELARISNINIANPTPKNNCLYKLDKNGYYEVVQNPATWLIVSYKNNIAKLTEVWQKPTSGIGFLKRTISKRRCINKFKIMTIKRLKKGKSDGFRKICK